MNATQTILPELLFASRGSLRKSTEPPGLLSRLRALSERIGNCMQGYDDYYAEMERSLPLHLQEQRRRRRHSDRLLLIAMLGR